MQADVPAGRDGEQPEDRIHDPALARVLRTEQEGGVLPPRRDPEQRRAGPLQQVAHPVVTVGTPLPRLLKQPDEHRRIARPGQGVVCDPAALCAVLRGQRLDDDAVPVHPSKRPLERCAVGRASEEASAEQVVPRCLRDPSCAALAQLDLGELRVPVLVGAHADPPTGEAVRPPRDLLQRHLLPSAAVVDQPQCGLVEHRQVTPAELVCDVLGQLHLVAAAEVARVRRGGGCDPRAGHVPRVVLRGVCRRRTARGGAVGRGAGRGLGSPQRGVCARRQPIVDSARGLCLPEPAGQRSVVHRGARHRLREQPRADEPADPVGLPHGSIVPASLQRAGQPPGGVVQGRQGVPTLARVYVCDGGRWAVLGLDRGGTRHAQVDQPRGHRDRVNVTVDPVGPAARVRAARSDDVPALTAHVDARQHAGPVADPLLGGAEVQVPAAPARCHAQRIDPLPPLPQQLRKRHVPTVPRVQVDHHHAGLSAGSDADAGSTVIPPCADVRGGRARLLLPRRQTRVLARRSAVAAASAGPVTADGVDREQPPAPRGEGKGVGEGYHSPPCRSSSDGGSGKASRDSFVGAPLGCVCGTHRCQIPHPLHTSSICRVPSRKVFHRWINSGEPQERQFIAHVSTGRTWPGGSTLTGGSPQPWYCSEPPALAAHRLPGEGSRGRTRVARGEPGPPYGGDVKTTQTREERSRHGLKI